MCQTGDLRLRGSSDRSTGRVEICNDEVWGAVCNSNWDDTDAGVACRQLSFAPLGNHVSHRYLHALSVSTIKLLICLSKMYAGVSSAVDGGGFGVAPRAALNNVHCTGMESGILDCVSDPIGMPLGCRGPAGLICQESKT